MPTVPPISLAENAGLAFVGEAPWPPAIISTLRARALAAATNPTGRPNGDVLREYSGARPGRPPGHWQIDFPFHFTAQEAALYREPWQHLSHSRQDADPGGWRNPHARRELRTALARLDRYLAAPHAARTPVWDWIDSHVLPDDTLLVVARDDDFARGLLCSRLFQLWWREHRSGISAEKIVTSFPFPWPPGSLLSTLTRAQEEQRLALARAARGEDLDLLNSAAAAAFGWPADLPEGALLTRLGDLNRARAT